jgi:hypothetical protein
MGKIGFIMLLAYFVADFTVGTLSIADTEFL